MWSRPLAGAWHLKAAVTSLLEDDHFFELVDLREFVGKRSNQQRRIRARIIGRQGKIRKLIEQLTQTQISIYNSTVVLVGEESGLFCCTSSIEMLAGGLRTRHRHRISSNATANEPVLNPFEASTPMRSERQNNAQHTGFEELVPGLAEIHQPRNRRMKAAQVDPEDE